MAEIEPRQSRAARGLLGWTQQELADAAGVFVKTIQNFENEKREPIKNNLAAIKRAFEKAGVRFIPAGKKYGSGVQLRQAI